MNEGDHTMSSAQGNSPQQPEGTVHYRRPGWITTKMFNPLIATLTRAGISVWGSRVLEVKGRRSGLPRQTPVNLLTLGEHRYLVAPRGEAEWVRNVRAADGHLDLVVGHRREHVVASELPDAEKSDVLRAYLKRWKAEVGVFFDGVGPNSDAAELQRIAPRHPVFSVSAAG
jgi:deazaflavin-dependent oxidoreductase (nitroreductase family)